MLAKKRKEGYNIGNTRKGRKKWRYCNINVCVAANALKNW